MHEIAKTQQTQRMCRSAAKQIGNNNVREINLIMFSFASIHFVCHEQTAGAAAAAVLEKE